ncbi:terpene synthase family protein [Nocardia sp. CDC159]|nr:terpene synthase family protein [Nocardia pulmonis]MCM6791341.1 terpene synthase family protein [Nocardia sp. CDC159]
MGFDGTTVRSTPDMCTGELARMWAPHGDTEGVQLLSDWLMWALLFDDYYCDDGPIARDPTAFNHLAANLMDFVMNPRRAALGLEDFDAFAASLTDILARVRRRASSEHVLQCALSHYSWMLGAACGVSDRSGRYMRSVDEHLIARPPDGGSLPAFYLTEAAEGTCLDADTRDRPDVQAFTAAAGALLTVPTDVASFARERDQRSLESNLVEIIAVQNKCSRQEAVYLSCALLEEVMELFVTLKGVLSRGATPALHRYLEQLSNIVSGTIEWQRRLPRYAKSIDAAPHRVSPGRLSDAPIHEVSERRLFSRVEPPPAIRWWWEFI